MANEWVRGPGPDSYRRAIQRDRNRRGVETARARLRAIAQDTAAEAPGKRIRVPLRP